MAVALGLALDAARAPAGAQVPGAPTDSAKRKDSSFPKTQIIAPVRRPATAQPFHLTADELEYDTKNNRVYARGKVEAYYNNDALTADQLIYDQSTGRVIATGNVKIVRASGEVIRGESAEITEDFRDAFIQNISLVGQDQTRIAARRAIRRDGNVTEFEQGKFSPCRNEPGKPPLWCISAARIVHDQQAATITYQDAAFEIFGVPVLPLPYFQHADPSVKRKSGFLPPEIGSSSNLGFTMEVPYFFALAPNYDFTFHPMYAAKQGILWQGEWRHRLRIGDVTGTYSIKLAGIDQSDSEEAALRKDLTNDWRGSVHTRGRFSLSSWWSMGWDVIVESDDTFRRFYKLDNILQTDRVNYAYIAGISDRNYLGIYFYHLGGLLLNDTSLAESKLHPVVDYNYIFKDPVLGGELSFNANALAFSQDLTFTDSTGTRRRADSSTQRVVADVGWRRRLTDPIGQVFTPFFQARGDVINLQDTVNPLTRELESESVARGLATGGVLYSYPWATSGAGATHVVEPIGQIIARQNSIRQRDLTSHDMRSVIYDDTNLFELDKMSGLDRIETGVRANYGLQYTMQAFTGGSIRLLAGQSYHLSGDNIYRNPGVDADGQLLYSAFSGLERSRADYVLGAYVSPVPFYRVAAQARFDERNLELRRADVFSSLNYGLLYGKLIYTFAAQTPGTLALTTTGTTAVLKDQQDLVASLGVRLTDRWSAEYTTRFDIDDGFRLQDVFQLKYADECFVLTAQYIETHIVNAARDLQPDRTIMLRFELKHLGDFRYKTNAADALFGHNQPLPQ